MQRGNPSKYPIQPKSNGDLKDKSELLIIQEYKRKERRKEVMPKMTKVKKQQVGENQSRNKQTETNKRPVEKVMTLGL